MRLLIYILACYTFYLAIVPCKDAMYVDKNVTCSVASSSQDTNGHHDADSCSPLCICNCCASAISKIKVVHLVSYVQPIIYIFITPYLAKVTSALPRSIWQPPREL